MHDCETALVKYFHEESKLERLKGEENSKRKALRSLSHSEHSASVLHRNVPLHHDISFSESTSSAATAKTDKYDDDDDSIINTNYYALGYHLDRNMKVRRCHNKLHMF